MNFNYLKIITGIMIFFSSFSSIQAQITGEKAEAGKTSSYTFKFFGQSNKNIVRVSVNGGVIIHNNATSTPEGTTLETTVNLSATSYSFSVRWSSDCGDINRPGKASIGAGAFLESDSNSTVSTAESFFNSGCLSPCERIRIENDIPGFIAMLREHDVPEEQICQEVQIVLDTATWEIPNLSCSADCAPVDPCPNKDQLQNNINTIISNSSLTEIEKAQQIITILQENPDCDLKICM